METIEMIGPMTSKPWVVGKMGCPICDDTFLMSTQCAGLVGEEMLVTFQCRFCKWYSISRVAVSKVCAYESEEVWWELVKDIFFNRNHWRC